MLLGLHRKRALMILVATILWSVMGYLLRGLALAVPLALAVTPIAIVALYIERHSLLEQLRPSFKSLGLGILEGLLLSGATYCIFPVFIGLFDWMQGDVEALYLQLRLGPQGVALGALLFYLVFVEELLWRFSCLEKGVFGLHNPHVRVFVMAGLYGAAQIGGGSRTLVLLAVSYGLVWGYQRLFHRSFIVPLTTHVLWDFIVMIGWPIDEVFPHLFAT